MSDIESPEEVFYLSFWDADADDRRGRSQHYAEELGVWFSKANAQAEADRRNAEAFAKVRADHERQHATATANRSRAHDSWVRAREEHRALCVAGLREGEFDKPEPEPMGPLAPMTCIEWVERRALRSEDGMVFVRDYWEVETVDINDEIPTVTPTTTETVDA